MRRHSPDTRPEVPLSPEQAARQRRERKLALDLHRTEQAAQRRLVENDIRSLRRQLHHMQAELGLRLRELDTLAA